jgi:hypothetical protein
VRLSEHYAMDDEATARLRARRAVKESREQGSPDTASGETARSL